MWSDPAKLRHAAWFVANLLTPLPAAVVAIVTVNSSNDLGRFLFGASIAWGAAAIICVRVIDLWHWITHRFESLPLSTILAISAIVGAFVGMIGATMVSAPSRAAIVLVAALLGSFQGAATAWFIVGPELQAPPEMKNDPEEEEDETSNPPTSAP